MCFQLFGITAPVPAGSPCSHDELCARGLIRDKKPLSGEVPQFPYC